MWKSMNANTIIINVNNYAHVQCALGTAPAAACLEKDIFIYPIRITFTIQYMDVC